FRSPADALRRRDRFRKAVHVAVRVVQRLVPELLPREDLGVLHEEPPERDERAVGGLRPASETRGPRDELRVALARAIDVDALLLHRVHAVLAEAGDAAARAPATMIRAEQVAERPLPLAAPHQSLPLLRPP